MKENTSPLMVTIRCLAYNHEPYIRQCLEGFVMQKTNFRFEAIVHDDASTDGTAAIIREYAKKYPDIIKPIFETENQYSKKDGSLRRIMDAHTHGKYVAICEGDDYWIDPLKLQKQVDFLERNPKISYVFTGRQIHDERKNIIIQQTYRRKLYTTSDILAGFNPGIQSVCFKKECIDGINFSSYLGINGDRLIPYLCSLKGKLAAINDVTAVYRKTGLGVSTKIADDAWFEHASLDFYKFHKILSFPNMNSYYKGEARYILAQLKKSSLIEIYKSLKNINEKITIINFISMLFFSVVLLTKKCFQWKIRKIIKDEIQ